MNIITTQTLLIIQIGLYSSVKTEWPQDASAGNMSTNGDETTIRQISIIQREHYETVLKFLITNFSVSNILTLSLQIPHNKIEAHKLFNGTSTQLLSFRAVTVKNEYSQHCRIDKLIIELANLTRIKSGRLMKSYSCRNKPLLSGDIVRIAQLINGTLNRIKFNFQQTNFCRKIDCFFLMYASPLYEKYWGSFRQNWFRLNTKLFAFSSHPTPIQFLINQSDVNPNRWQITKIWLNDRFLEPNDLINKKVNVTQIPKWPYSYRKPVKQNCTFTNTLPLLTLNKGKVTFKQWSFHLTYSNEVGIKLFNLKFNSLKLAHEISLQEAVTSYSGFSPFIQTMTSIESMYNIGELVSELSPGTDCPDNSQYISFTRSKSSTIETVQRGVCVFYRKVTKPIRRHFDMKYNGINFAVGRTGYVLYVRFIVALYNYDYIFDYTFHETGVFDVSLIPTGYIHVDNFNQQNITKNPQFTKYGYTFPKYKLIFPLHVHLFLFKFDLDVISSKNKFRILEVKHNNSLPLGNNVWLKEKMINWENESAIQFNFQKPKYYLICNDTSTRNRCLQIINRAMVPDILSSTLDQSIGWKKFQLIVTKRRANETNGSNIFNGVNLVNSTVKFSKFLENNDNLVNEDLVLWSTVGTIHTPTIEDTPNTITSSNELKITFKPFNLFDESPISSTKDEFFTTKIKEWVRGNPCRQQK